MNVTSAYCAIYEDGEYTLVGKDDMENLYLCKYCFSLQKSRMFDFQFLFSILLSCIVMKSYNPFFTPLLWMLVVMLMWEFAKYLFFIQRECNNVTHAMGDRALPGRDLVITLYWSFVFFLNGMYLILVMKQMLGQKEAAATTGGGGPQNGGTDDTGTVANTVDGNTEEGDAAA